MTRTETIDTLYSTTWAVSKKEAVNQVFKSTRLLTYLRSRKKVQPRGGRELRFPAIVSKNNTMTWFGADGELSTEGTDPTRVVWYPWRYTGGTCKQVFTHVHQNSGKAQIRDMVKDDIDVCRLSIAEGFEIAFNGAGDIADGPNGFQNLVPTVPDAVLTVGGWPQAANPWWQGQTMALAGEVSDVLSQYLRRLYRKCSAYGPHPTFWLTDGDTFDLMEDALEDRHLFVDTAMKDLGWPDTPVIRGAPVIWSQEAEAGGVIRAINGDDIYVLYDQGLWMDMGPWKEGQSNVNRVSHILSALNMVARRRSTSGTLTAVV